MAVLTPEDIIDSLHPGEAGKPPRHGLELPTEELRGALKEALNLDKEGKLSEEDLAKMDATVSQYLNQQLKVLAAQGMIREEPRPLAWHQNRWVQMIGGLLLLIMAGVLLLPRH
ncbi:hypothetical protein EV700_2128 [Fluviicoccus keumensis]|uniref:Uncharacterized protein n=1 Tax=Fluviicoccus keumensis TaxID=1435465 RepID=A0A4Q7Z6L0_9GAMM|nr:hypothetical protein [Fluviicoccus keumensis]RZU45309.1 hypothetical protein EV700_2128 [Fluviicoccus keumensis]